MLGTALSLVRDLPPASSNETAIAWLLTRQFAQQSFSSLLVKGASPSWRDQMLQVCADTDSVRYLVLSATASHIAFAHRESRALYAQEADKYRNLAIKTLPAATESVKPENFFALFNFSCLMTLCCLAKNQLNQLDSGHSSLVPASVVPASVVPEWALVQRHGRALIWPYRGQGRLVDAMHGPPQRLFAVEKQAYNDTDKPELRLNPHDKRLKDLGKALQALANSVADPSCLEALHLLRNVWNIPHREAATSFRDVALMWMARVNERYIKFLRNYDPIAIIIFAHYCVLWSLTEEHYWYMQGHAQTMLSKAVQCLDWRWQDWLAWPISMVLGDTNMT